MDNVKHAYCCELVFNFIQHEHRVSAASFTIVDFPLAFVGGINLTKFQALEAMRKKINNEIDRLIKEVADEK